jgi:hypothetical protein
VTISLAIKLSVLGLLTLGSGLFSMLAVGAWWYSWGTGAPIEVEGWLFYGSAQQCAGTPELTLGRRRIGRHM